MIISYVVFENEDDAIRFHQEAIDSENNLTTYGILAGSYKLPTRFCNELEPAPHKREGWMFLTKRGWWVCPACKRPSVPTNFELNQYGYNIMEKIKSSELGTIL